MQKEEVRTCPYKIEEIHTDMEPFIKQPSPFLDNDTTDMYEAYYENLPTYQILVVGAGGLGCEIVKNLAVSGIRNIHLIDMDTIDLTNLNRQFLFRQKDIGRYKAEVVAEFVMKRCPGVNVIPHTSRVQSMNCDFYTQFGIVIGGLDNIEARKFLNAMVHQLNLDSEQVACVYIDGATQGFQGQSLLVTPFQSSCYSCSLLDGLQTKAKANYCTIANTPRTPQHCIQYVLEVEWQKEFPDRKRDNDNMEDMKWVFDKSVERANKFKIEGVTEMLTMGVAKNIIPAIASTNALIAAFCTNEAMKLLINGNPSVKNYYIYKGGTSVGSDTYEIAKKADCITCNMKQNKMKDVELSLPKHTFFRDLLKHIEQTNSLIQNPFITANGKIIYNPMDSQRKEERLNQTLGDLLKEGILIQNPQNIYVNNMNLKGQQKIILTMTESE